MKITDLKGEELSSVSFVMDYVELAFHGPIIRFLGSFKVVNGDEELIYPEQGSRDRLCELIGKPLKSVSFSNDTVCHLAIGDKTEVVIELRETEDIAEHMHFVPCENEPMDIW